MQNQITNIGFISTNFPGITNFAVCSKAGDPNNGGWTARHANNKIYLPADANNYLNCSSFNVDADGAFNVRKENFAALHFILLDDLGTKIPIELLGDFKLSWRIETSPGNYQGGIILKEPITDANEAAAIQKAIIDAGLCDKGANGLGRWARLPNAINGKSKYFDEDGKPFQCRVVEWNPDTRYTPQEIIDGLNLKPVVKSIVKPVAIIQPVGNYDNEVFTQKSAINPVISAFKDRGLYKSSLGAGKHDVTCLWLHEHTDQLDSGTAYFEPSGTNPRGGYCCQHSHRDKYHINDALNSLGIDSTEARNKPVIHVVEGELRSIVDAAEKVLADKGNYYQMSESIVTITNASMTNPAIKYMTQLALTCELSSIAIWEKYDGRTKGLKRCDPPQRHINVLYDAPNFNHLPELKGLARQPYFCESTGELIQQAGYNATSKLFAVFDPQKYNIPLDPTEEDAQAALALISDLIDEFHFASPEDRVALLSAILTASVRVTLPHAPGFHTNAATSGIGKSLVAETVASFASEYDVETTSYPTNSEEATKIVLALLIPNPPVIVFDDMSGDMIPHSIINSMLTSDSYTGRILGQSKMVRVSTRTLILSSGINVVPVRDMVRRIVPINLDANCENPAILSYKNNPIEMLRKDREKYVSAALTINLAYKKAGSPKTDVPSIATYGGAWSNYCRHPLIWLGLSDPAVALFKQIQTDPDAMKVGSLLLEMENEFGSNATTVRKIVDAVRGEFSNNDLLDALYEFPVVEHGNINPAKLGWLFKKNANRIINGVKLERAEADGRTAWRIVRVTQKVPSNLSEDITSLDSF